MKVRLIGTLVAVAAVVFVAAGSSGSRALAQATKGRTNTAVTSSVKQSVFGQDMTFTATVTRQSGRGKVGGKVQFYDGLVKIEIGMAAVRPAEFLRVTFVTSALAGGPHTITAVYSGNASFAGSTSRPLRLTVKKAATTTVLDGAQLQTSVYGEPVTFTATVTAKTPRGGTPTGRAQFAVNAIRFDPYKNLAVGKATLTTSALAVGTNTIGVTYGGDANFAASTSRPLTQTVNQAGTTTTAVSSVKESPGGLTATITVTVTASPPGGGTFPTGTVTLVINGTISDPGTLSAGKVVLTTKVVKPGQTVTVTYGGDANFKGSSSTVKVGG